MNRTIHPLSAKMFLRRLRSSRSSSQVRRPRASALLACEVLEERRVMAIIVAPPFIELSPAPKVPIVIGEPAFGVRELEFPGQDGTTVFSRPEFLTITFVGLPSTPGGTSGPHSLTNPANWRLIRDGLDVSFLIASIELVGDQATVLFHEPLSPGTYQVALSDNIENTSQEAILDYYPDSGDAWRSAEYDVPPLVETAPNTSIAIEDGNYEDHAVDAAGNYIVLYTLRDGVQLNAYAQRFSATGERQGDPLLVAEDAGASSFSLSINANGTFVIGWREWLDETHAKMFARLYNSDGSPLSSTVEFDVGTGTLDQSVDVAIADDGSSVIVWQARDTGGNGAVWLQRLRVSGSLVGGPELVGQGNRGRIAMGPAGNFVIAWSSDYSDDARVFIERYNADGNHVGQRLEIADANYSMPTIAIDDQGRFAVLYQASRPGQSRSRLMLQRFDFLGQMLGPPVEIDTEEARYGVASSSVSMDGAGRTIVQWRSIVVVGGGYTQGRDQEYLQLFGADGVALGPSFEFDGLIALADDGTLISAYRTPVWVPTPFPIGFPFEFNSGLLEASPSAQTLDVGRRIELRHFTWPVPLAVDLNGDQPGLDMKVNFVPGGSPVRLGVPLDVEIRPGTGTLTKVTITIEGYQLGDTLLTYTSSPRIYWSFVNGVLTLTGDAEVAYFQAVLNDLWYATVDRNPGETVRIRVVATRGEEDSEPAYAVVSIHEPGRSSVAGRHVFYNNSSYDGSDLATTAADDAAIAPDKAPLFPGGAAILENVTSYSRGINGIMIDLAGEHGEISFDDFIFRIGSEGETSGWGYPPAPTSIVVRPGAGVDGSDRVVITWADGAIRNTWLQVTMLANGNTGLAEADVFYFGSRIGDTGNSFISSQPQTTDALKIINRLISAGGAIPTTISDQDDFNRDGRITSADLLVVFNSILAQNPALETIAAPEALPLLAQPAEFGRVHLSPASGAALPLAAVFESWSDDDEPTGSGLVIGATLLMEDPEEK